MSVLVIAEAGVNHNNDLTMAKRLVDVAVDAGADIIKFQTFTAKNLATVSAEKAPYQKNSTDRSESQFDMLKKLEMSDEMHTALKQYCSGLGIEFLSSGFDISNLDFLVSLGINRIKIPSGEITNLRYLRHVGGLGKPVLLSTGMSTLGEVETALEVLVNSGTSKSNIVVLHCNTEYPTPMSDVNLMAMSTIRKAFDVSVGYSDHTKGSEVAIAAVALGACVIEKHITLDHNLEGPDHSASANPKEFSFLVRSIRSVEQALGSNIKTPSQSELRNRVLVRKSLVAACPIMAGEQFTYENVTAKRPGHGISPMDLDKVVGRISTKDYKSDEMIIL